MSTHRKRPGRILAVAILSCSFISFNTAAQDPYDDIRIEFVADDAGGVVIEVSGFTKSQSESLAGRVAEEFIQVWIHGADPKTVPSIVGDIQIRGPGLRFKPTFPFKSAKEYDVRVSIPLDPVLERLQTLELAGGDVALTELTAVFPTVEEVPENILKFYVHFSAPMRKGDIYRFIHLRERIDDQGTLSFREVEIPFLEIEQEFWSVDSKRLTLLLDPGRIKRGLRPREELGPIFEPDREYELYFDEGWLDANGNPVVAESRPGRMDNLSKVFKTSKSDRIRPDPKRWVISVPKANTRSVLTINFEEPLDSAMLMRVIEVYSPEGLLVPGRVALAKGERVWKFEPQTDWEPGEYKIHVDNRLEDLCGNSIAKVFDVDVFDKSEPLDADGETALNFNVH